LLEFESSTNIYKRNAYQQNKSKIEELLKGTSSVQVENKKNSNFLTGLVIGGALLAIIGLMTLFGIKIKKRRS